MDRSIFRPLAALCLIVLFSTERVTAVRGRSMPGLDAGLKRLRQLKDESWRAVMERAIQAPVSG